MQFFAGELTYKIVTMAMYCAAAFDLILACRLSMAYYSSQLKCTLRMCQLLMFCFVYVFIARMHSAHILHTKHGIL